VVVAGEAGRGMGDGGFRQTNVLQIELNKKKNGQWLVPVAER